MERLPCREKRGINALGKTATMVMCIAAIGITSIPCPAQNHLAALLRDEYALGLTPTIKSAGMGGAYVGVDGVQSMNPASLSSVDFIDLTAMYANYDHDDAPMAHRGRLDATLPVPRIGGAARLMFDSLNSEHEEPTRLGGAPMEWDSYTLGGQYGRNITDWLAVGVGAYPYEKAEIDMRVPSGHLEGSALSQIGSMQLGTLFRPHEKINVGGQFIYIIDELDVEGPGVDMEDDFYIHYFALGASAMPLEGTLLAVDYWNGEAEGNVAPGVKFDVDVDRWNFGVQQRMCKYCDLRVGSNNGGFTAGFTIHVMENVDVDYAYVNKALRDKESVFGETESHGVSVTYRF